MEVLKFDLVFFNLIEVVRMVPCKLLSGFLHVLQLLHEDISLMWFQRLDGLRTKVWTWDIALAWF